MKAVPTITTTEQLRAFARGLDVPREAVEQLVYEEGIEGLVRLLNDPLRAEEGTDELHELLTPDEDGFRMLSAILRAAATAPVAEGLPEGVYEATMRVFGRFVRENLASFGRYGFDRWFWTWRQTSGLLVRIGSLEYERTDEGISMHIPSDADLSRAAVLASVREAKRALGGGNYYCRSWMLSHKLKKLLPEGSNVRGFRDLFRKFEYFPDDAGYKLWVFKNPDLAPEDFPEDTSLQRNMKNFVLHGGKVGASHGFLRDF